MNDYCIICLKIGSRYDSIYVNNLVRSIRKYTDRDIICFTDDPSGIDDYIQTYHMDPRTFNESTWKEYSWWPTWSKIEIFGREEIKKYSKKIYFDIDLVIQGDINPILNHDANWAAIKSTWKGFKFKRSNPDQPVYNTSVMVWKDISWIYERWENDWENIVKEWKGTDNWYWDNNIVPTYLPKVFYSYREGSKPEHYWENNWKPYLKYQQDFSVCLFHQEPDIKDLNPEEHIVKIWNGTI